MLRKRTGQAVTLDLILGVSIFLATIVLVYYLFGMDILRTEEEDAAEAVIAGFAGNAYFHDNEIDGDELDALSAMDCATMKEFFNTNKNICIYATDKNGNLVELDGKNALGCGGIKIDDVICGESG